MSCEFDNILNFRDAGRTVNDFLGRKVVKEGVLYRSARPDDASLDDRDRLRDKLGIRTVIDLRTKTEHAKQAEKRQADLAVPALLKTNAALAEPVEIPGLRYRQVKVTGRSFELFLLGQLSWWSLVKFFFLFLLGYRLQAISIIGREVMVPRGLVGLGLDTMDRSGAEVAEALRVFIEPGALPALVHCTHGKDRTGMIIALVFLALGVPAEAIEHDYLLSQEGLRSGRDARVAETQQIGLTADWVDTPPDFVARVRDHAAQQYGGVQGYLESIGMSSAERAALLDALGA